MLKIYRSRIHQDNLPTMSDLSHLLKGSLTNYTADPEDQLYGVQVDILFLVDLILNCFVVLVLCLYGVFGNGITLSFMADKGFQNSSTVAFRGLALFDLFLSSIQCILQMCNLYKVFNASLFVDCTYFLFPWNQYVNTVGIFIVVSVVLLKFIVLCYQTLININVGSKMMFWMIIVVFSSTVFFILPLQVLSYFEIFPARKGNLSQTLNKNCTSNDIFHPFYHNVCLLLTTCTISVFVIACCCLLTILKLETMARKSLVLFQETKEYQAISAIIPVLCASLTILVIAPTVAFVIIYVYLKRHFSCKLLRVSILLMQLFCEANVAILLAVYVWMSRIFKDYFKKHLRVFKSN